MQGFSLIKRVKKHVTYLSAGLLILVATGCQKTELPQQVATNPESVKKSSYLDYSQRDDRLSGGVKLITVNTPKGDFKVWTKRVGNCFYTAVRA